MMFSDRIARLRKEKGLNQKQLADLLSVSVDSVRRWEQGKRSPDVEMLRNIAQVLNTTVSYISGETDDANPVKNPPIDSPQDASSLMERLIKSNSMVVYDIGDERFLIPATHEGFDFLEKIRTAKSMGTLALAR